MVIELQQQLLYVKLCNSSAYTLQDRKRTPEAKPDAQGHALSKKGNQDCIWQRSHP